MDIVIDAETPLNTGLCAKYKRSFAYATVTDRLPVIVTSIIDFMVRDKNGLSDDCKEEVKSCIGELSELKYLMQTAKPLSPFSSAEPDTEMWNTELERLQAEVGELTFFSAPWLFVECYLYRRIWEVFVLSDGMKCYDPFSDKKESVLDNSWVAVLPLFQHLLQDKILESHPLRTTDLINEFVSLIKHCLWANRMDLSMTSGNTEKCKHSLDVVAWDDNILVNDMEQVLNILFSPSSPTKEHKLIDYVIDNTGLELLCDLCMADFLVTRCKIDRIRFRLKRMPWFVSDATENDLKHTLAACAANRSDPVFSAFASRWQNYLDQGVWSVHEDTYWSLGLNYDRMVDSDPALYSDLQSSLLIIFKGDLHYRKLVQDTNWEPSTPFRKALGRFCPAPLVALRTLKADTVAGLAPGQAEEVSATASDWLVSGAYGIVQFASPQQ